MAGRPPPHWLAWTLCGISLALLLTGAVLQVAFPEGADDGIVFVAAGTLSIALVPLVGALVAARLPANPYGWLWCAGGLTFGLLAVSDGLRRTGADLGWLPGALGAATYLVGICVFLLILLLFPTGRLPSRAWRWLPPAAAVTAAVGVLVLPFAPSAAAGVAPGPWAAGGRVGDLLDGVVGGAVIVLFLLLIPAAASLLLRFRRAGPIERQQLKWFVLAAVLGAVTTVSSVLDVLEGPTSSPVWGVLDRLTTGLLPAAVGIAVLRYRLYAIDRIVSRTVSYGLLTAVLVGLYLLVVALLRPLLEPFTGSSTLAVAASTLAVAAVFNPARRRLQASVDRRFDRTRYDAARAVEVFAARLRTQVDLDEVIAGLRDTVVATVAPTHVAVWLRDTPWARGV